MIRIGEFAKICGTSIQTLRFYDSCGVLPADKVDPFTGYRSYAPEAVEKYKRIRFYQDLGFSLAEIKDLLSASDGEKRAMLLRKKKEMQGSLGESKSLIAKIDEMCKSPTVSYPLLYEIMTLPFKDDPDLPGRWKRIGRFEDGRIFPPDEKIKEISDDELVLLPGGACFYKYFWTKGVIWRIHPTYLLALPNGYRIETVGDKAVLYLDYVSNACIDEGAPSVCLVYEQTFRGALTEMEARKHIDRVDLPYVPDPDVLGVWETCDYVPRIEDFDEQKQRTPEKDFWILRLHFHERGLLTRTQLQEMNRKNVLLKYTKGTILNEQDLTAEAYQIKRIGKTDYLFVQHKSGDYYYGGKTPQYYVFKREGIDGRKTE